LSIRFGGFLVHPRFSAALAREFTVWTNLLEQTFAWLGRYRRLKDYEWQPESSESWISIAMIHLMLRRLEPA
jgi:transposase